MLHLVYGMNSPMISASLVRHSLIHFHLSHMAVHHLHHLHYHHFHLLLLAQSFILNLRLGSSVNPFLHRPFPLLPDWFHGLSGNLICFYFAQQLDLFAWYFRLSRLLVGFRRHLKSTHFHSRCRYPVDTCRGVCHAGNARPIIASWRRFSNQRRRQCQREIGRCNSEMPKTTSNSLGRCCLSTFSFASNASMHTSTKQNNASTNVIYLRYHKEIATKRFMVVSCNILCEQHIDTWTMG